LDIKRLLFSGPVQSALISGTSIAAEGELTKCDHTNNPPYTAVVFHIELALRFVVRPAVLPTVCAPVNAAKSFADFMGCRSGDTGLASRIAAGAAVTAKAINAETIIAVDILVGMNTFAPGAAVRAPYGQQLNQFNVPSRVPIYDV
jgi:hypothetical protein